MSGRNRKFADEAALAEWIRQHKASEQAKLHRVFEHGSAEDKRALAARNHAGVGRVRWRPELGHGSESE